MKEYPDCKRETNPRVNANFLSIITFFFTRQIFEKGVRRGIYERDIYDVLDSYKSENLGERMEQEWEKTKKKKLPVIACLFKMFGLQYMAYGIIVFIVKTALMVVKPLSVGKMISYFDPNKVEKMEREEALFYAFIFLFSTFCWTLFTHNQIFYIHQFVLKINIALSGLIYRKSLRLSSASTLKFTSGHAITLITKDVLCFNAAPQYAHDIWIGVMHVGLMTYIIYLQIGVSAFAGVGFLVFLIPVQAVLGKLAARIRAKTAIMTDKRLKLTQEVLNAIKVVKVYTLENLFMKKLGQIRSQEVKKLTHLFYVRFNALIIGSLCSNISLCLCIILYAALGKHINAEQAFVVWTSFEMLRAVLTFDLPLGFNLLADMMAATKRITKFMYAEEVGDFKTSKQKEPLINLEKVSVDAGFEKTILKDITLRFKSGLNVVTGSVGSGKSFLLKLLLNEISSKTGVVDVVGEVSYASQDPWLFPETIKQNIIFYKPYDADRYREVVRVCALRKDISMLPERDSTFLTDKGLNLSKGQQARVNLARAVYHDADIYLFDDSLSAVDAHVSGYIFDECIRKFLKDKICVFVTQNHSFLKFAQQVIVLDDGRVEYAGSFDEMPKINLTISDTVDGQIDENTINDSNKTIESKKQEIKEKEEEYEDSALLNVFNSIDNIPIPSTELYYELQAEGKVPWEVYKKYFLFGGGILIFIVIFVTHLSAQITMSWADTFIRGWVNIEPKLAELEANNLTNTTEFDELSYKHTYMLNEFVILILGAIATNLAKLFVYFAYVANISRNLHNTVITKVLAAPMSFFDVHLPGSILNKLSRDLTIVDELIPFHLVHCIGVTIGIVGVAVIITTINWRFLLPSAVLFVFLYFMRSLYLKAGRGVQRLEGATRNSVVGHVNASMEGLLTIRSNKAQNCMKNVFDERQDIYNSATYMGLATSRALGLFADLTGFLFLSTIICYFFFFAKGKFINIIITSLRHFPVQYGSNVGIRLVIIINMSDITTFYK
ncbi:probable multidrug resistance-associated protein lethal(2)03659 [Agrilus planipennis]|uniref:Probable multidrug resistance-associated protein lethal(2)03659 n=1 Tax=Agrilus planipennis TaxID=224129 RepID=A0A7F5RHU9_AGRPL|nr:probable multidrug resistance-associated protein lethal(2)03659 [Agrilus planipennis]